MQSPFGKVSGLEVRGVVQSGQVETVKLSVQLKYDSGLNSVYATLKDGGRSVVAWQGAGTLDYTVSSHKVDISVGYVHSRVDKHKMRLSIVVHFPPHGWVRLPETVLQLAGNASSVSFLIPQDVAEENLIASTKFPGIQADVERVYGKRLPEECRDLVKRNERKPVIYASAADVARSKETGVDPLTYAIERKRQRLDDYNSDAQFNSLAKQRLLAEKMAKERIDTLLDSWEIPVRSFLKHLFGTQARVKCVIQKWHARRKIPFYDFMHALLHSQISLSLTDTALFLFSNSSVVDADALSVPYSWMTTEEQAFCYRLYVNRNDLFADAADFNRSSECVTTASSVVASTTTAAAASVGTDVPGNKIVSYQLRRFVLDDAVVKNAICGRYIVQQFVLDCIEYGMSSPRRVHIFLSVLSAVGRLYVGSKMKDVFLLNLKIALEQVSVWDAVNELGLLVNIAGSTPAYRVSREDILTTEKCKSLPPILSTPYRLA